MKYYNIDMVVRGALFNKQYPIHWYAHFLKFALDAVRDLTLFHNCGIVNTKLIKINSYNAVELPCDYVDYIRVGVPNGPYNKPLVRNPNLSNLNNYNSQGQKVPYDNIENDISTAGWSTQWYETYLNDYGERIGRWFNFDKNNDTFEVIPQRNEIQLHPAVAVNNSHIILEYISDGIDMDPATMVLPYWVKYIQFYIDWQMKLHGRHYSLGDRAEAKDLVDRELRKVRAVADPLTVEDIRRISRRRFTGTYKN